MKLIFFVLLISKLAFAVELKEVNLQQSWFDQFQFAGYYIAKEKGFYEEEGLNVNIRPFDFGVDVSKEVSLGNADFGIGRETLILDYLNKYNNIVSLYALFQNAPLVLLSKQDLNINSIKDFENKKLMATIDDANQVSINAMLKSQHINLGNITYLKHTHNINDLIEDKTDIISAYLSKAPFILNNKNIPFHVYNPSDYGFDMYSDFLFTNNELEDKSPEVIKSFRNASLRGWEYAFSNIEETVDLILKKYNSQKLSKSELIFEAQELKKLAYYQNNSLGNLDNAKLQRIVDLYAVMGYIKNSNTRDIKSFNYKTTRHGFTQGELSFLKNKNNFSMCIQTNQYPYQKLKNNEFSGIISKYKLLFEKLLEKRINIVPVESENIAQKYLQESKCDFATFLKKEDYNIIYTKNYLNLPLVLLTKDDNSFIYDFEQLKNKKILISNSQVNVNFLKAQYPEVIFSSITNEDQVLNKIQNDKVYGLLTDIPSAIHFLKEQTIGSIHIGGKFEENVTLSFGLNQENTVLARILNKLIIGITKNQQDQIVNDFSSLNYKEVVNYDLIFKIVGISTLFIIFLIILIQREKTFKRKIIKLNEGLEVAIKNEVDLNREKDEYIFKQAKLASMGEMIANIAHQWKQPLNRINVSNQVILTLVDDEKPTDISIVRKHINDIENNIFYMSDTINDFSGFFHPNKTMNLFNVNDAISKAHTLIKAKITDIDFSIDIKNHINLKNYENELIQVVMVLLDNSIYKLKNTNKQNKKIDVYTQELDSYIEINVVDNGGGISTEIIDRIFEPYFSTKFKDKGVGIGLYMAKMLIEESMSGKILVETQDEYTHFKITLPRLLENT